MFSPAEFIGNSFYILCLNRNNKYWDTARFLQVVYAARLQDVRMIMQTALKSSATSIVLAHNHPSGNLVPSEADKDLTKRSGRWQSSRYCRYWIIWSWLQNLTSPLLTKDWCKINQLSEYIGQLVFFCPFASNPHPIDLFKKQSMTPMKNRLQSAVIWYLNSTRRRNTGRKTNRLFYQVC